VAIYRCEFKIISRAAGHKAVAAAAYRASEKIVDQTYGETHDFTRKSNVKAAFILAPDNAPDWMQDRAKLWNAVEAAERRKDAQLSREVLLSLPHELTDQQREALVRQFVNERFVSRGMIADVAIHGHSPSGDERNYHAHVMLTTRALTLGTFGPKERSWNGKEFLHETRVAWAETPNRLFERLGLDLRVDHRSLADQGTDREPEPKPGPNATEALRNGEPEKAERVIGVYGMGLTQHVHGFENIAMLVNLLLMRGHIGRPGAGICPVRGHSNVQGQRTVGISEKPELVPLDKFAEQFDFDPPRDKGMTTVEVCEGVLDGSVQAFIGLGGNFLRAIPDQARIEPAWEKMRLTVQISTKLNRGHLFNGRIAYLLPCLGRSEEDLQAGGPQTVTIEDSFSHIHASIGHRKPASEHLKSEMAIVAGIAKETLPPNPKVRWDEWTADYSLVRDLIAETYHEEFHDMNARIFEPGGFYRGNSARERIWKTESGKAQFTAPDMLAATDVADDDGRYRLVTVRSNDQFNTTIYGYSDRLRGIEGKRNVVLINPADMARAGLAEGQRVSLTGDAGDGHARRIDDLEIIPFDLPDGTIVGYYPELNPLIALHHHDRHSKTPASKAVPVRIEPSAR